MHARSPLHADTYGQQPCGHAWTHYKENVGDVQERVIAKVSYCCETRVRREGNFDQPKHS
eukprot:5266192-Prymnesium_polylepis.1